MTEKVPTFERIRRGRFFALHGRKLHFLLSNLAIFAKPNEILTKSQSPNRRRRMRRRMKSTHRWTHASTHAWACVDSVQRIFHVDTLTCDIHFQSVFCDDPKNLSNYLLIHFWNFSYCTKKFWMEIGTENERINYYTINKTKWQWEEVSQ